MEWRREEKRGEEKGREEKREEREEREERRREGRAEEMKREIKIRENKWERGNREGTRAQQATLKNSVAAYDEIRCHISPTYTIRSSCRFLVEY